MEGFGPLAEFCHGMVLLRVQTLDDTIEVGHFCQQKLHVGEMISVCDQAEDIFSVSWVEDLVGFVALYLQSSLNSKHSGHLVEEVIFVWLEGWLQLLVYRPNIQSCIDARKNVLDPSCHTHCSKTVQ